MADRSDHQTVVTQLRQANGEAMKPRTTRAEKTTHHRWTLRIVILPIYKILRSSTCRIGNYGHTARDIYLQLIIQLGQSIYNVTESLSRISTNLVPCRT